VVFRYDDSPHDLLSLRTCEDVFVLLYRTDDLPAHRKGAIPLFMNVARDSRAWNAALACFQQLHRSVRRVTFRVIAQMTGRHGYRRQEVRDAVLTGVQARWPGWKPVADDAHLEVWTPIVGPWAIVGLRLSGRQMRHRTYKQAHRPASLRPTLAAAMVALSEPRPADRFCDPMCGGGTLLVERALKGPYKSLIGGDSTPDALRAAQLNLSAAGVLHDRRTPCALYMWDAAALPLRSGSVDVVTANLPFGVKVGSHESNRELYAHFFDQLERVVRPGGRIVLLTSEKELMRQCLHNHTQLQRVREVLVGVLGRAARIYVLRHP